MTVNEAGAPFIARFLLTDGTTVAFPVHLEPAREAITNAVEADDSIFRSSILQKLDDRGTLQYALMRLYNEIVKAGVGSFFMGDDDGAEWAIPSRNVVALAIIDPESKGMPRGARRIGYDFERDPDSLDSE